MQWISILGLGSLGVFARYILDTWVSKGGFSFPLGTLLINLSGSLVAGIIYGLSSERGILSETARLGWLVGFCGGFTTFSAYALQSLVLLERGRTLACFGYLLLSPTAGVFLAYVGVLLTRVVR